MRAPLVNRAEVKRTALQMIADYRPGIAEQMNRVSRSFVDEAETALRLWIRSRIETLPSKGKTVK